MLTYDLELRGDKPLYEFIYYSIREDILNGKIMPFEKLPSKRALAAHLRVSVITVKNAYEQLAAEGYITSEEKRGYFVCDLMGESVGKYRETRAKGLDPTPDRTVGGDCKIKISQNIPDPSLFPFSVWSKILRSVLSEKDSDLLKRVPYNGVYALRKAIADNLYGMRGISADPECIIIGAGTEFLYNLIIQMLGRNRKFALENPGYQKLSHICKLSGVLYTTVDIDECGMSAEILKKSGADVIHISPSHHYPTGIVMPVSRRREILDYANSVDGYIIEDDYDGEFRFSGKPIPALKSFDIYGRVIYMNTFSQTISPSIRISYMILPEALMEKFSSEMSFYSCTVPSFEQYTLAKFIEDGYFEKYINRMRIRYKQIRESAINTVKKFGDKRFLLMEHDAGTHFLLKLDTPMSDKKIYKKCLYKNLELAFVSDYMYKYMSKYKNCVIMSYAGENSENFEKALKILRECMDEY